MQKERYTEEQIAHALRQADLSFRTVEREHIRRVLRAPAVQPLLHLLGGHQIALVSEFVCGGLDFLLGETVLFFVHSLEARDPLACPLANPRPVPAEVRGRNDIFPGVRRSTHGKDDSAEDRLHDAALRRTSTQMDSPDWLIASGMSFGGRLVRRHDVLPASRRTHCPNAGPPTG